MPVTQEPITARSWLFAPGDSEKKMTKATAGSADIVLIDPSIARTLSREDFHVSDYSPWEGHDISAWPVMTVLRGKVMVENGEFKGALSDGKYLKREITEDIRTGPAL